jgi:putative DNA primase/helicase
LDKVTSGNADYQAFLARVCGYGLTGSTRDHAMFFLHGDGRNGKGTFVGTVAGIMGDYHRTAPTEAFMETKNDRHSTELAMLRGARLVTATETEENRRWAEATIKKLTGGDLITARFMRQDFFEYRTSSASLLASSSSAPNASRSANRDRSRRSTPRSRSRSPAPRPRGGQRRAAQT